MISTSALRELAARRSEPCVSVWLPTHVAGSDVRQNALLFKNLLKHVEGELDTLQVPGDQAKPILKSLRRLIEDEDFWQHQSAGLGVLATPETTGIHQLHESVPKLAIVSSGFHIKPLCSAAEEAQRYYVLAFSPKNVRLLECSRETVRRVGEDDLPGSLEGALELDEFGKALQFHTTSSAQPGRRANAVFHGHGAGDDDEDVFIDQFVHKVATAVDRLLKDEGNGAPLVLATVEEHVAAYQRHQHYAHLLDRPLKGNADGRKDAELRDAAWRLVQPVFQKRRQDSLDDFGAHRAKQRAVTGIDDVLRDSAAGRIQTLFAAADRELWAAPDSQPGALEMHGQRQPRDLDLVNVALCQTLEHGGRAFVVPAEQVPEGAAVAGILRY